MVIMSVGQAICSSTQASHGQHFASTNDAITKRRPRGLARLASCPLYQDLR
jgi:hypothetical protein